MKMKAVTGIMLTLLLIGMLALMFNIKTAKAEPGTIIVPDDYPTIQGAINAASPGDTIYVEAATYVENVLVNKSFINLIGESVENTIIDGNGTGHVIHVEAFTPPIRNVTITKFTIRNCGTVVDASGIYVMYGENITIKNNNITVNNGHGVYLGWSRTPFPGNNIISNNNITNNVDGVYLWDSNNNTISGNNIVNNTGYGNYLSCSVNNTFYGNDITDNGYGVYLWGQVPWSTNNTFYGNDITNNGYGVYLDVLSGYNIFYHNNFVYNTVQVENKTTLPNVWDDGYPSGGNYWSDHACTGNPSDGSQPYIIDVNNIDHYPFQDPDGWLLPPVGGVWVPVNKFGLLAPYTALASTILVATAATAIYIKRRKKKQ